MPAKKIVINLSPGNVRKRGASYDLPVALSILTAMGELDGGRLRGVLAAGELGLDGSIRGIHGILPIADAAKKEGAACLIVPAANEAEARLVEGLPVLGAENLEMLCRKLREDGSIGSVQKWKREDAALQEGRQEDFADIKGQQAVKRAAEVAVAGHHNLLMVGPPGCGKSMIARRIPSILPSMTREESFQITKVYSVAGMLRQDHPLITRRPFREVHQTVTKTALLGGGLWPKPGEISLASGGVLFLDELAEFQRAVTEVLRQPLEERTVRITRNRGTYEYPADVMLVAAMNPCPCGYFPDYNRCRCTPFQIQQYQGRERQIERYKGKNVLFNSELGGTQVEKYCELGRQEERMMRQAFERLNLTARTYHKVLKTARTIADLEGEEQIRMEHLQEALIYRNVKI